jgi:putative transposase
MAIKLNHDDEYTMYYCTFTCYQWLRLFEIVNGYDMVYQWFDVLKKNEQQVLGYVIMPNHLHVILYFPEPGYDLNKIIGNAKRFMAYEIIKRLEEMKKNDILEFLFGAVTKREKKKAQRHKVFEESFDAKGINSEKFLVQKLNYIHRNPVSGRWSLVKDYADYEHSSASFYETGKKMNYEPFDFRKL